MPELGLGEERLHPHLPLAHGLLVRLGRVVGPHLFQVLGIERAMHDPAAAAFSAASLEWARIARRRVSPVDDGSFGRLDPLMHEQVTGWTVVGVPDGVVHKVVLAKEWSAVTHIRERNVGTDPSILQGHDVLDRAIGGVSDGLAWPELAPKAD